MGLPLRVVSAVGDGAVVDDGALVVGRATAVDDAGRVVAGGLLVPVLEVVRRAGSAALGPGVVDVARTPVGVGDSGVGRVRTAGLPLAGGP
ncbi:hypothetical protein [Knoellia subterranea]|uniref:Uncharacterized protein n=1 Tax=Knoellia subterranea KCTC 19937 TaxID=1385521 RepID=A0A0A0JJM0_9MICO|nr:hypothetical protein [Knoellia subterranea]KGN37293.1 hypothetical protein N803_15050 [Knoellia subterranea KCTC 19937]